MLISYIIPTRNRADSLARVLAAIGRLPPHAGEVVLVDNASDIPTAAPVVLDNGLAVRLLFRPTNEGAAARNHGVASSDPSSEWMVMLDDDSFPLDDGHLDALRAQPPEVAAVGRTHGFDPAESARIFRVEYDELDRARIEGRTVGFAKVAASASGKILGATILGDNAALALQEFVVAMEHGLSLHQLANTAHPYPTHAGLARALASRFAATRLEGGLTRAALRLLYGFEPPSGPARIDGEPSGHAQAAPVAAGANGHGGAR